MNPWERLERMIGKEQLISLSTKTVMIVGLGGVGGYVVESMARCNIGTLILVDFDVVTETNLNRQIIALHSTIGQKKTELFRKRIYDIHPDCHVIVHDLFLTPSNVSELFSFPIDYVIDACDDVKVKKALILESLHRHIPILSCMGTGNKLDASKFEIVELEKTSYDPLAIILRKWKKYENIKQNIMVLCSTEKPLPVSGQVGSISFVPSVAGLLISNYVIRSFLTITKPENEKCS